MGMAGAEKEMTVSIDKGLVFPNPLAFGGDGSAYELMPHRYARIPSVPDQVLLTSYAGEYLFVTEGEFEALRQRRLNAGNPVYAALRTRQLICDRERGPFFAGLAAQHHTRKHLTRQDPALHIFVLTLRCDHRCHYCQVSPRRVGESGYDMSEKTAETALDRVFECQAPILTIEFQGGESALSFNLLRKIVTNATARAEKENRLVRFVLTSTLHLLTDDMLRFCRDQGIELSTSLDGPAHVHDANRINGERDSFERTIRAIDRAREICGSGSIAALATVTRQSLPFAKKIVDTYIELGFGTIALRPLSPFGFAARSWRKLGYSADEFLAFYKEAINYLIGVNLAGVSIEESYATLLLTRILTPFPTPYVDLESPSAAGRGVLVYNYDGGVYVSDEGRMLAAMGDARFRMGNVEEPLETLQRSPAMGIIRNAGNAEQLPGCKSCAFVPYCGADPVFHVATQNDPVGHRPTSEFCARHTGLFRLIFDYLARKDEQTMRVFLSWITQRPVSQIAYAGYRD